MYSKKISCIICILMFTTFFSTEVVKNSNEQVLDRWEVRNEDQENSDDLTNALTVDSNVNINEIGLNPGGTGGLADSPWPMFRQNLNHTGVSPCNTSRNLGNLRWSFETGHHVISSPAINFDGTIYVGSDDNKLYAIHPNGTKKWNFITDSSVYSSPAVSFDETIYVGSHDSNLYAINPDGTQKWSFKTKEAIYSSPGIGSDGTIYVGSFDHKIYAVNSDGTEKWNYTTGGEVHSSPAIGSDGMIYVGSWDHKLYAIKPDGTEKWNFTTGSYVSSSPAIGSNGTIYIGSGDNRLYAIKPDGTEKWNFTTGSYVYSSPAIGSDGTIYVGSYDNKLYAINPDGTEKWNFITGNSVFSSPAISYDGIIFVGSDDNKLHAINPDGTERWNFTASNDFHSSPAIGPDGTIYIGSDNIKLYAIGIPNIPPIAIACADQTVNEGDIIQFNGLNSYDPDGTIESYQWDFDSSDGLWWETGAVPDATGPTSTHTYGDDGIYIATLRVTDNDNLSATDICNVTVQNVNPTVSIESVTMNLEIGLRVAGRKYNNVSMTLYEDSNSLISVSIERLPGSPNVQMAWIPVSIDFSKSYSANVTFIPENPPNVGANPVWIYIKSKNGTINQIHHTFNVQQSKKRNSEHWNHIEPWEVELNPHFIGLGFEISSHVTDPGSDDETLTFTYGSQTVIVTHLNEPPNLDPYPSSEVNPRDISDTTTLVYEGPGTITLVVKDDDNIRLGMGQGSDSFDI